MNYKFKQDRAAAGELALAPAAGLASMIAVLESNWPSITSSAVSLSSSGSGGAD